MTAPLLAAAEDRVPRHVDAAAGRADDRATGRSAERRKAPSTTTGGRTGTRGRGGRERR